MYRLGISKYLKTEGCHDHHIFAPLSHFRETRDPSLQVRGIQSESPWGSQRQGTPWGPHGVAKGKRPSPIDSNFEICSFVPLVET